jgi:hypothetical protein
VGCGHEEICEFFDNEKSSNLVFVDYFVQVHRSIADDFCLQVD